MKTEKKKKSKILSILGILMGCCLIYICLLCLFAAQWYVNTYGKTGFDSIIFFLYAGVRGAESGLISQFLLWAALPAFVTGSLLNCLLFLRPRKTFRFFPLRRVYAWLLGIAVCVGSLGYAMAITGAVDYTLSLNHPTTIFEDAYVSPENVEITFPENKRNLVVIYLESMETSFFSQTHGGAMEVELIPELWQLANENVSFSHGQGPGGFRSVRGTTWTTGAMVGHLSGVPLKPSGTSGGYSQEGIFLPGLTTMTDILHENGYYQELIVGSDATFGDRDALYLHHGTDRVLDIYTAYEDGIVPQGYHVWWGMEDDKLFEYAKQELAALSAMDQPFALSMLTVDTHHIGGWVCESCPDRHPEQYSNVLSCSSAMVAEFVEWLRQQPYYDNTTIVIYGDHPTMDEVYIKHMVSDNYIRRGYNCIINSAVTPVSMENREFTTLDMFPTTLAAMGCTIPGDRLGLGTNLFSGRQTLAEELGFKEFDHLVSGRSDYYNNHFLQPDVAEEG